MKIDLACGLSERALEGQKRLMQMDPSRPACALLRSQILRIEGKLEESIAPLENAYRQALEAVSPLLAARGEILMEKFDLAKSILEGELFLRNDIELGKVLATFDNDPHKARSQLGSVLMYETSFLELAHEYATTLMISEKKQKAQKIWAMLNELQGHHPYPSSNAAYVPVP